MTHPSIELSVSNRPLSRRTDYNQTTDHNGPYYHHSRDDHVVRTSDSGANEFQKAAADTYQVPPGLRSGQGRPEADLLDDDPGSSKGRSHGHDHGAADDAAPASATATAAPTQEARLPAGGQ